MRRKRWIKASLLTMIAAAPVAALLCTVEPAMAAQAPVPVQQLVDIISNDNSKSQQREDAAAQLIERNSTDAKAAVNGILNNGTVPGQLAVARAVAKAPIPNPDFIPALGNLLGSNHNLTEAAAAALANCDGQQGVFDVLRRYADAPGTANVDRAIAIRAMGSVVQETTANYLINQLNAPNRNVTIATAATDALTELTGITTFGNDPVQWQQWWNGMKGKNADQFRSTVLATRDLQFKLLKQHEADLVKGVNRQIEQSYQALLNVNKNAAEETLLGYLNDPTPEIRAVGVQMIYYDASNRNVRAKLLKMIDDSDDGVRLNVVKLELYLSDRTAVTALINRLDVEKNPQVKAILAQALGKIGDIQAAPALVKLLDDPNPEIVLAGAKAIAGDLGKSLQEKDPKAADAAASKLRAIFLKNDNQPGSEDLCAACLSALAALRDKNAFDIFRDHVVPAAGTVEIRRAALQGLGNLGDESADQTVADQLQDKDATIRLEAARALRAIATPAELDIIFKKMKEDPDDSVRGALWVALSQKLYPKLQTNDLVRIANDLRDDPDKSRRLATLKMLGDAYAANHDGDKVAFNEQDIAAELMAMKPPEAQQAIDNLKKALDYWKAKGNGDRLQGVIEAILDAELKSRQWDTATKFAADQIKFDSVYQETVGPRIRTAAGDLINGEHPDLEAAKTLIDDALKMEPKLDPKYINQLGQLQDQLKAKAAQQ